MSDLDELLDKVVDQHSFLDFAKALCADRDLEAREQAMNPSDPYSPGPRGWENQTIEDFLEASIAWAEDSGIEHFSQSGSWQEFARFLNAGKFYE